MKYHFIGIGGIGMSGLARILLQQGHEVSGSDLSPSSITESLQNLGATIVHEHAEANVPVEGCVVFGSDIKKDHPEYRCAHKQKRPMLHRAELLAEICKEKATLAVTGTHGKTSTSSLLTWVLQQAGMEPGFAVGGWIAELNTNASTGASDHFVLEADESDGSFIKYRPQGAILLNIDRDHMDHYGTDEALNKAFKKFAGQVANPELLFWCGDDLRLRSLRLKGISYGFNAGSDLRGCNYRQEGWGGKFDVIYKGHEYPHLEVSLPGQHQALNALAVFGLALALGLDEATIRKGLKTFPGVGRRCEKKGDRGGVLILDDYGHHPVEILATLKGIRSGIGERRLVVVFQPHRYTRTKDCLTQFGHIFDEADEVFVTDIYAAREEPLPGVTAEAVLEELHKNSKAKARYVPRNSVRSTLVAFLRPHDVVVTIGAGDVTKLGTEIAEHFLRQSPKRLTVGIVCGGVSPEHEISLSSTKEVLNHLCKDFYEIKQIGITKQGRWICEDGVVEKLSRANPAAATPLLTSDTIRYLEACDVVLPMLHGTNGEDGVIQGFLEVLGKAYVGCGHRSSAICMDKAATKQMAQQAGVKVVPFKFFSRQQWNERTAAIIKEVDEAFGWPMYVKPRHLGSSIEVSPIANAEELIAQAKRIWAVDTDLIVESRMVAREVEFAVWGNHKIHVLPPGEIHSNGNLHTYAGKYSDQPTPYTTIANMAPEVAQEGMRIAETLYRALGCSGLARLDFFLDANDQYWLNEVNPIPGFTKTSFYPLMCVANDKQLSDFWDHLIILALERRRMKDRLKV